MSSAIPIPAETAARAATSAVGTAKSWVAGLIWLDAIFVLAFIAGFEKLTRGKDPGSTAFGVLFWIALLGAITLKLYRRVKRIRAAEALARTSATTTWLLDGRKVIPVDAQSIPRLDLMFTISATVRSTLLAVPQARVVERG